MKCLSEVSYITKTSSDVIELKYWPKLFKFWNVISENLKNCKTSPFLSSFKFSGVKFSINLDSKFS